MSNLERKKFKFETKEENLQVLLTNKS